MPNDYRRLADQIADQIKSGVIPVGTRLLPQREYAYREGVAFSTAARVYQELSRRGLVAGEVGRGSFVTRRFQPVDPEIRAEGIGTDLSVAFLLADEDRQMLGRSAADLLRSSLDADGAGPAKGRPDRSFREVLARGFAAGSPIDPDTLLVTGSGRQAISAAIGAIVGRGGSIAVEELTYPYVIATASMLGCQLIPVAMDEEGVIPTELDRLAADGVSCAFLQPMFQNPTSATMSDDRREEIADILKRRGMIAIEDRVYAFLKPSPSLAENAPDRVIRIESLSKSLMAGLPLGAIAAPSPLLERLGTSVRSGGWTGPSLAMRLVCNWITLGELDVARENKRKEAREMNAFARQILADFDLRSRPDALHLWLTLPHGVRSETFARKSLELGVAVSQGSEFAVRKGVAPRTVRLSCATSDATAWRHALEVLSAILKEEQARAH